jgi:cell division septation protein DedD
MLSVPALGMGVMLLAGGIAVSTAGTGRISAALPALPASPLVFPIPLSRANLLSSPGQVTTPVTTSASPTPPLAGTPARAFEQTWVVQVAAFTSPARSVSMVQHLTGQGWPAYQVEPDGSTRGLTLVRVGPYRTAGEADEVRAKLRATPDFEGAFVRNITTK